MKVFSDLPVPTWQEHLSIDEPCIIAADFHAPYHSTLWCNRMASFATKNGIKTLVIVGDGLDMHAFSGWGGDPDQSWSEEMGLVGDWLWTLYHLFERIYWVRGNHEDRIARATNWQLTANKIVDAILLCHARELGVKVECDPSRLVLSNYPFCYLGPHDEWMLVHPKSYSRIPGRIANQLAMIHEKNIMAGHAHRAYEGRADNGKQIIDLGGLFDEARVQYRHMSVTTHPVWDNGFAVFANGYAKLLGPWMDWRSYDE